MNAEGIGAAVRRKEDPRFLTGRGRYVADLVIPGELHCHIVRSPYAHARIRSVRTGRAAGQPGVVAVFTGEDMAADGVGLLRTLWPIRGTASPWPSRPASRSHATPSAMSASLWLSSSPRPARRPLTPPSWSRSTMTSSPSSLRRGMR